MQQEQNNQQQPITQTIVNKQYREQQHSTSNNFQNPYFRFLYSIHSEETKKDILIDLRHSLIIFRFMEEI
jgi:hypothetical protein